MRVLQGENGGLFQQTVCTMQRQRVFGSAEVDPRYVERDTGTDSSSSFRRVGALIRRIALYRSSGISCLGLEPKTIGDIPALGLGRLDQNILLGRIACWILNRSDYLIEESQIVEISLRLEECRLIERIAGMNKDLVLYDLGSGVMQSGEQDSVNEHLLSFGDRQRNIGTRLI